MQEDVNKCNNKSIGIIDNVKLLSGIMLQTESSLKCIAAISDKVKKISHDSFVQVEETENAYRR